MEREDSLVAHSHVKFIYNSYIYLFIALLLSHYD